MTNKDKNSPSCTTTKTYRARSAMGSTDSGPTCQPEQIDNDYILQQRYETEAIAAAMPYNVNKGSEYDAEKARCPMAGARIDQPAQLATGSTLSEKNNTGKTGESALPGKALYGQLSSVQQNDSEQVMTTNQGVPIADNQNSLTAGYGGPALLKDFILREKITHFDHERIPERIVHARGSGAHGYFECTRALSDITCATVFSEVGKRTPVFTRFSTVAGERGSKDTARDVRGFAVKFYSDQGNWDLVGNNIPVFFIQDAMKFPDLVHAVKPEPHHAMPQAASAHDTFWDFVSLMPESTHMLLWQMSDRAIPRSYRMMQGFGVHTFRFVNRGGESVFVKFHWTPKAGVHSLLWDEAVKISGADPDFHRRDLWETIESGEYPEWELGLQVFTQEQADHFSFDVLDPTKLVPEELVPVVPVGKLVLNRNPDNFFAETEQVAFCAAHIIPGIDFTNDPLLAGRIHSYVDTQISRLGGPNFHEIPVNRPLNPAHNNQRDGMHRQTIHRGRVSYEPNSLGGGCPFQAGQAGFISFPEQIEGPEHRIKPEKFAEHFLQAKLFFDSQSGVEQQHIIDAFVFELSKVTVPAVRRRTISLLRNVSDKLAGPIAQGLGMPLPDIMPSAMPNPPQPEVAQSEKLSLCAFKGEEGIKTRKIAILVSQQSHVGQVIEISEKLMQQGAVVRLVAPHIGLQNNPGEISLDADASLENSPGFLFDAMVIADGSDELSQLASNVMVDDFIREQYRHKKAILALGAAKLVLQKNAIGLTAKKTPGVLISDTFDAATLNSFVAAVAKDRHFDRADNPATQTA